MLGDFHQHIVTVKHVHTCAIILCMHLANFSSTLTADGIGEVANGVVMPVTEGATPLLLGGDL